MYKSRNSSYDKRFSVSRLKRNKSRFAWTVFAPLLMTWLLTRVSGVPLLEADLRQRSQAYRDYLETTPSFVPGRPRRRPAAR